MAGLHRGQESHVCNTDIAGTPWTVVKTDCRKRACLNAMCRALTARLSEQEQANCPHAGRLIVGPARHLHESDAH
jgi:hypothetical protein